MSLENKVGRSVLDLLEIAKNRITSDILLAKTEGKIIIGGDNELNNLLTTINASLDTTFDAGVSQVLRTVRVGEKASKPKTKSRASSKTKS